MALSRPGTRFDEATGGWDDIEADFGVGSDALFAVGSARFSAVTGARGGTGVFDAGAVRAMGAWASGAHSGSEWEGLECCDWIR